VPIVQAESLRRIGVEILQRAGATRPEAETVATLLVDANLDGHDSHGIVRIPQYVGGVDSGQIVPGAISEVERQTPATAVLNGNWGFGHVTARDAMRLAVEKAATASIGLVTVHRCNHVGRLGSFALMAAEEGMLGLVTSNGHGADLAMAPYWRVGSDSACQLPGCGRPVERAIPLAVRPDRCGGGRRKGSSCRGSRGTDSGGLAGGR